jgi:hypothetical protein
MSTMADHQSRAAAVWFWDRILVWVLVRRHRAADRWLQARSRDGLLPRDQEIEDRAAADFLYHLRGLPPAHQRTLTRVYEVLRKECLRREHNRLLGKRLLRSLKQRRLPPPKN